MSIPTSEERYQSDIGIFWDYDSCKVSSPLVFATELLNSLNSLYKQPHPSNCAIVFGNFSESDRLVVDQLKAVGYEVIDTSFCNVDSKYNICMMILLWLWDTERARNGWCPCVAIASSDVIFLNLITNLVKRGVSIVSTSNLIETDTPEWRSEPAFEVLCHDTNASTEKETASLTKTIGFSVINSPEVELPSTIPPSNYAFFDSHLASNVDHSTGSISSTESELEIKQRPKVTETSNYSTLDDLDDLMAINEEQQRLQDELLFAIKTQNVQLAVTKLRRIYSKQFDGFRIPEILTLIALENGPVRLINYSEITFTLGCIQWCFNGVKDDSMESYTYRMNTDIAHWLLEDLQKKHFENYLYDELLPVTVYTVQNILKQVAEFDFCLEILHFMNVQDPVGVIYPQLHAWTFSTNHAHALRAKKFALQLGISVPLISDAKKSPRRNLSGSIEEMAYLNDFIERKQQKYGFPSNPLDQSTENRYIQAKLYQQQQQLQVLQQQQQLAGGAQYSLANRMRNSPRSSSSPFPTPSFPSTTTTSNNSAFDINNNIIRRLLQIIAKYPQGILGARIPDIYKHDHGETLFLQHKKLKDVLLGLGCVEMIGTDGPGDKLFRIVNNTIPRQNLLY